MIHSILLQRQNASILPSKMPRHFAICFTLFYNYTYKAIMFILLFCSILFCSIMGGQPCSGLGAPLTVCLSRSLSVVHHTGSLRHRGPRC